jgi:hypothetical protein
MQSELERDTMGLRTRGERRSLILPLDCSLLADLAFFSGFYQGIFPFSHCATFPLRYGFNQSPVCLNHCLFAHIPVCF